MDRKKQEIIVIRPLPTVSTQLALFDITICQVDGQGWVSLHRRLDRAGAFMVISVNWSTNTVVHKRVGVQPTRLDRPLSPADVTNMAVETRRLARELVLPETPTLQSLLERAQACLATGCLLGVMTSPEAALRVGEAIDQFEDPAPASDRALEVWRNTYGQSN